MRKGDPANDLYFLASGQVSAYIQTEAGLTRVRARGPGSTIGEMALYLNDTRTADIYVDQHSTLLRMYLQDLERMRLEDPALASALHAMIARQLALRIRKDQQGLSMLRK
jgi:sulfate permease, SulP family